MKQEEFTKFLENVINEELIDAQDSSKIISALPDRIERGQTKETGIHTTNKGKEIAEKMVKEALSSGLEFKATTISQRKLSGGNTAEFVGELTLNSPFVFKMDSTSKKLAEEGNVIRSIKNNKALPHRFRDLWPQVYAINFDSPYAYLMEFFRPEDGWFSLEARLYDGKNEVAMNSAEASRYIHAILDLLLEGYEDSRNIRNIPNIKEDYFLRMKTRLDEASDQDKRFISKPLIINGKAYKPWREYLSDIERNSDYLRKISPSFTTVVHGDPNPGNILLNVDNRKIEIKLIDPKEWMTGDYLFDLCKITHFIEVTGPLEKPAGGIKVEVKSETIDGIENISYSLATPEWTSTLVETCLKRLSRFTDDVGDTYAEHRYELGMASNLLGLPIGRLNKGKTDEALLLYTEGIIWLDKFCNNLPS